MTEPKFWEKSTANGLLFGTLSFDRDVLSPQQWTKRDITPVRPADSYTASRNPPLLLAMDNPGTPGLRLLSLDGGGIRGLSMLIILEDLMWKLKVAEDLPDVPHPCDYFDLMGGTSTGGLIALMLGRLRMSVKDAVKAYGELSKEVFLDVKSQGSDGRFKASKLEKAIRKLWDALHLTGPRRGDERHSREPLPKCLYKEFYHPFVCAMNAANMSLPVLFRTYNTTNNPAIDCKIWQAGRATSAAPTFFKQIRIGPPGIEEAFVDGGIGQNNPIATLLLEAQVVFPDHQIACIISLGTGQPHTIKIPTPSLLKRLFPLDVIKAIKGIATDCEKQHQLSAHHFDPVPHVYFRFNVERGMQDIQLNQWERLGDVAANTRQYLLSHPTQNQLVDAVKSLVEKIGRVSTQSLSKNCFHVGAGDICPPPSRIFQGRQDILAKMDEYFSKDVGERHIYVLHGLGGSGKTEIALKFLDMISRHQAPRFTKQFFINASSLQTLDTALKNIAIAHKIGTSSEDGLLSHSRVGDMNETDAIDLLLLSAVQEKTIESTQSASEIVKELSFLPLAIIQAGAYIFKFDCLHRYLSIYSQNRAKLLSQHSAQSHDDYRWTVYTTWQISFEQLSKAAASIPETIFEQASESPIYGDEQEAETLQEARKFLQNFLCRHTLDDEPIARECMTDIMGMSINLTEDTYLFRIGLMSHMDSLIHNQTSIKFREAESLRVIVLEKQKQLLGADHPDTLLAMANLATTYHKLGRYQEAEPLDSIVLEKQKQLLGADHPDTLWLWQIWLPHTVNLEDTQRQSHLKAVAGEAEAAARCRPSTHTVGYGKFGCTYHQLGSTKRQSHLKAVCWRSGSSACYQEAEPLESSVLEKRRQLLGADHPDTLRAMANLAVTYHELGRYQEAEPLESIALEKRKQLLGADHPDTLLAMANLAATYHKLGRSQEAEPLQDIVLEKQKQLLGADHPRTLSAMAHLAATYHKLGRYKEAESLESIVLEKRREVLGPDHPGTLRAMRNLAATSRKLGRSQEAEYLRAQHDKLVGNDGDDSEA
ncbi:acyl transferase/acyl hydrolase/lysophospholipase [Mycena leptocephala]|nr:acyl transferase/acyl hydrolase/lysophospholipase [Mycena leptocephala]